MKLETISFLFKIGMRQLNFLTTRPIPITYGICIEKRFLAYKVEVES